MSEDDGNADVSRKSWIGFWSMIAQQTQNAFNDKFAQFLLIPLGGAIGFGMSGGWGVEDLAGLLIVLPFILFAPLSGWLSDRFSKRDVLIGSAILQLVCLFWITGAVALRNMPLALAGFFAIAAQSVFFSPAKMGLNKELLGSERIGFASAIQQMLALLGMLAGQILAGRVFDVRLGGSGDAWRAAAAPLWVITILAVGAIVLSLVVPRISPQAAEPFRARLMVSHFFSLREMWGHREIGRVSLAIAFFWGFAGFLNLWSVKYAKVLTAGSGGFGTISSLFMAAASVGMILGFALASWLQKKRVDVGWVPLAGLAMTAGCLVLALLPGAAAADFLRFASAHPGVWLQAAGEVPAAAGFLLGIALLALASALFLAPLNAWIQDAYPADKRGEFQASVNLQNCMAGMIAVALVAGSGLLFQRLGLTARSALLWQLILLAALCLVAAVRVMLAQPAPFIRLVVVPLIRLIYGIRTIGAERVPAKGGVLLLPNHVTFVDAFLLSAASPRPLRFVMDEVFSRNKAIRIFTALFDTVNIRRDKPLDAIREVIRSLEAGDAIVLFPEGQLTRTGTLSVLQKGFELIARKAEAPLIPVWADGSWGSVFSFERGRFFTKLPKSRARGITVAFGGVLPAGINDGEALRRGLRAASAEALADRCNSPLWKLRKPPGKGAAVMAFRQLREEERRELWRNGRQIGMVNAIPRGAVIHCLKDDPVSAALPGLLATFPALYGGSVVEHERFEGSQGGVWVGGDVLREAINITQITKQHRFFDFGPLAADRFLDRGGVEHFPCLAVAGRVVAMSMPNPPASPEEASAQPGHMAHAWGRVLPGWSVLRKESGEFEARGPASAAPLVLAEVAGLEEEFLLSKTGVRQLTSTVA